MADFLFAETIPMLDLWELLLGVWVPLEIKEEYERLSKTPGQKGAAIQLAMRAVTKNRRGNMTFKDNLHEIGYFQDIFHKYEDFEVC